MSKKLQVVEPFLYMSVGDILELSADGKSYVLESSEEVTGANDSDTVESTYYSKFTMSTSYAKELLKHGVLCEITNEPATPFINIFDEIDKLLHQYNADLSAIDKEFENRPQCLKVEKFTVLNNLIKVLSYLKSLKK